VRYDPTALEEGGMGRSIALLALAVSILSTAASAQDWSTKRFALPPDEVYKSAVKVIGLHHEIKSKDPENRVVRFHVGTTAWSWGYNMGLSVEPQSNGTSVVKIAIEKSGGPVFSWGSGKKEVSKILRWIEEDLIASKH
jgi:hypothetical protein